MKKMWSKLLIVSIILSMVALTGCSSDSQEASTDGGETVTEVSVGVLYPTSGDFAQLGSAALNAVKLAAEDINASGGIKSLGGAKFKLEIMDPGSKPESTRSATENLIQSKNVSAITGDYSSSLSLVTSEVTERAEIPFVTASISDGLSSRGFKYFFQVSPKGSMFGQTQVEFAKKVLVDNKGLAPKAAIVFENTSYGQSTSGGLKKAAEELGFEIVLFEAYESSFTDASPLVTKIKSSGAKILFPVSYLQDAILIQKAIKQMDAGVVTVGGGAGYLMPDFYNALGEAAEGVVSVASWNLDVNKEGIDDVAKRYKEKYGSFLTEHSGEAYSATWVIKHAIEKAGSADPNKIRDALASLIVEEGQGGAIMPGGNIEFDETGWNSNVHPVMIQWQDGLPRTVYPQEDASSKVKLDF